jgi:Protein of unknown function (DUF1203)
MTSKFIAVAISTALANEVRHSLRSPQGFPAQKEPAGEGLPCRHCLRVIAPQKEQAILFTYNRFTGVEDLPQPGPVYIHADHCERYDENSGFPEDLRGSPRTLEAYSTGRRLIAQEYINDGAFEPAIAKLFANSSIEYIQVHSTTAGCFTFRIERPDPPASKNL